MKPTAKRPITVLAICAACTVVFLVLWWRGFVPLQELELFAQDWQTRLGRKTPADERLVLIGIDKPVYSPTDFSAEELKAEPALALLQKNFPWSRAVWARLIEKLGDAGAKVIVLDLVFAASGDGDDELKQALDKYKDRVVIGYNISDTGAERGNFRELQLPNASVLTTLGTKSPVEDDRLGYVNIWPDFDGVLRHANFRKPAPGSATSFHPKSFSNRWTREPCANSGGPISFLRALNPACSATQPRRVTASGRTPSATFSRQTFGQPIMPMGNFSGTRSSSSARWRKYSTTNMIRLSLTRNAQWPGWRFT